jgi:hypothetical protein
VNKWGQPDQPRYNLQHYEGVLPRKLFGH